MTKVSTHLLCLYSDKSAEFGMLKRKVAPPPIPLLVSLLLLALTSLCFLDIRRPRCCESICRSPCSRCSRPATSTKPLVVRPHTYTHAAPHTHTQHEREREKWRTVKGCIYTRAQEWVLSEAVVGHAELVAVVAAARGLKLDQLDVRLASVPVRGAPELDAPIALRPGAAAAAVSCPLHREAHCTAHNSAHARGGQAVAYLVIKSLRLAALEDVRGDHLLPASAHPPPPRW